LVSLPLPSLTVTVSTVGRLTFEVDEVQRQKAGWVELVAARKPA
jgi:hypothetical protein